MNAGLAYLAVASGILSLLAGRMVLEVRDRNRRILLAAVALAVAAAGIVLTIAAIRSTTTP